jgi:hypothetical protein
LDPTDDTPPAQEMAGDSDGQEGSTARQSEGERMPGSNGFPDSLINKNRLLHPGERRIDAVQKHPVVLGWNLFLTLAMLAAAGLLSDYVSHKAGKNGNVTFKITLIRHVEKVTGRLDIVIIGIWVVYGLVLLYMTYKIVAWISSYLVITDKQILVIAGLPVLRFASVRISQVTSWYLRESFGGNALGYKTLVVREGDHDGIVRIIGHVPGKAVGSLEEALPSAARYAGDEEAFKQWNAGGMRRHVRLVIAILLICLLVVLAVAAVISPRIRTELSNETEIIALLPILIVLITPKN